MLDSTARGIAPAGADLVTYGPRGAQVFARDGHARFRLLTNLDIELVHVAGRFLYAAEGGSAVAHVIDLRTRVERPTAAGADVVWSLLTT